MDIKYFIPSAIDADVQQKDSGITLKPRFFSKKGSAIVGSLESFSSKGDLLDRVVIVVNGDGKLRLNSRFNEVVPVADD